MLDRRHLLIGAAASALAAGGSFADTHSFGVKVQP